MGCYASHLASTAIATSEVDPPATNASANDDNIEAPRSHSAVVPPSSTRAGTPPVTTHPQRDATASSPFTPQVHPLDLSDHVAPMHPPLHYHRAMRSLLLNVAATDTMTPTLLPSAATDSVHAAVCERTRTTFHSVAVAGSWDAIHDGPLPLARHQHRHHHQRGTHSMEDVGGAQPHCRRSHLATPLRLVAVPSHLDHQNDCFSSKPPPASPLRESSRVRTIHFAEDTLFTSSHQCSDLSITSTLSTETSSAGQTPSFATTQTPHCVITVAIGDEVVSSTPTTLFAKK